MTLVDSEAAFKQRCTELDGTGNLSRVLNAQNIKSYSILAYVVGTPQTPPSDAQFDTLCRTVFGAGFTLVNSSMLRRPHFEATTLVIASVKQIAMSEGSDKADTVKKMPIAEKRHRQEQQSNRLVGVSISGELEPSHQLLDLTNNILETGAIVWIAPSRCTRRDDEVQSAIKEKAPSVQIENQQLKVAQNADILSADYGSEIKFQWCLQRRGIAMDQCQLLSWAEHEAWVTQLLKTMSQPIPTGFQHVKIEQLIRADRQLWTLLAQECRGSLKPLLGTIPLDAEFRKMRLDPRVSMFLLPVPGNQKAVGSSDSEPKKSQAGRPIPAQKAGAKRRKTRAEKNCPEELKRFNLKSEHGPICWAYNLKDGCKAATTGKPSKCSRGYHVCANCHKPGHSVTVCRGLQSNTN